jgi:Glycosyltransferase family 87
VYGRWPAQDAHGDTYGPVVYMAYVPFRAAFGWSGRWDDLPAAHSAAVAFDLLTIVGLFALGMLIRGPDLAWLLAYAWAAFPFTLFTLESDSNDSLVALLVVLALVAAARGCLARTAPVGLSDRRGRRRERLAAAGRGVAIALAGLTKFAPLGLAPLFWRGTAPGWRPQRERIVFAVSALAATAVVLAPVLAGGEASAFWHDAIAYQARRSSPFSVWGLWHLPALQHLVQGAAVGLAVALAVVPRGRRSVPELAALTGAVLIALQLGVSHWFYLYIPWFFGPAFVAICAGDGGARTSRGSHPAGEGVAVPAAESGLS